MGEEEVVFGGRGESDGYLKQLFPLAHLTHLCCVFDTEHLSTVSLVLASLSICTDRRSFVFYGRRFDGKYNLPIKVDRTSGSCNVNISKLCIDK